jgi:hypothetical protein
VENIGMGGFGVKNNSIFVPLKQTQLVKSKKK